MDLFFFPHSVYPTLFIILFSPRRVSWLLQLDAHCGSERDTVIRDAPQFRLFCSLRALCAATLFSQHSTRASVYDIDVKDAPFSLFSLLTLVVWWILCDFSPRFSNLFFFFFFTSHVVVYVRLYLRYLTFFSFLFCLKIYSIMSLWWPAGEIGRRRLRSSDWLVVVVVSIKKWMVRSRATTTHRTMLLIVYYTLWSLLLAVVVLHISISLSGIPTGELYGRSSLSLSLAMSNPVWTRLNDFYWCNSHLS